MRWRGVGKRPDLSASGDIIEARLEAVVDRLNGVIGQLEAVKSELIAMEYAPKPEERRDDGG